MSATTAPRLLVLPADYTITFLVEPSFTLRSCSSSSSDEEDGFQVPFTTSPLDECRGVAQSKSPEAVRDPHFHATSSFAVKKKTARAAAPHKKKAYTLRASR